MDYVKLIRDYAKGDDEWTFDETVRNLKRMKDLYDRIDKLDEEQKKNLKSVEDALALEEWARTEIKKNKIGFVAGSKLSKDEQNLLDALYNTALGREGLIVEEFLRGDGIKALESLKLRGKVEVIKHWTTYSWTPNNTHIGIVGEKYPDNDKDWQDFRDSGASLEMSFGEFLEKRANGKIKWLAKDIANFISIDITEEWEKRYDSGGTFWVNFCGKLLNKEYMLEDIRAGKPADEVLFNQLVRGFDIDEFNSERIKILDESFHRKVIDARIKFLENKKKSL